MWRLLLELSLIRQGEWHGEVGWWISWLQPGHGSCQDVSRMRGGGRGRRKMMRIVQVWRRSLWGTILNFPSTFMFSYLTLNSCSPGCVSISTRSPVRPVKSTLRKFFFWCLSIFWEHVERLNWHSESLELLLSVLPQSLCHPLSPLKSLYILLNAIFFWLQYFREKTIEAKKQHSKMRVSMNTWQNHVIASLEQEPVRFILQMHALQLWFARLGRVSGFINLVWSNI